MYVNFETIGYVYILASKTVGTLYIGVTSNLIKRVSEHKNEIHKGFTQTHKVHNSCTLKSSDQSKLRLPEKRS